MAVLKKSAIPAPILPKETVTVDALGGDVIVTGLLLKDRFNVFVDADNSGYAKLSKVLAATVVDADGVPVYTQDEWEQFGALHSLEAIRLFDVARRLSGLDGEANIKK